jgi:hypothetical protein
MTTTAPPSSNPELPVTFGAENHFRSKSRLQPHPFNQTTDLATDETPMEHGLGAENCCFRPGFYSPPAGNQFDAPIPGFRPFPISVYSVFHPWPIELHSPDSVPNPLCPGSSVAPLRLSPFALNPRSLETPTGSTVQRFNNSTPRSKPQSSTIAGYVSLCESDHAVYLSLGEADHAGYVSLCEADCPGYLSLFEAMCTYVRLFGEKYFISGQKSTVARQPFSTKFARF